MLRNPFRPAALLAAGALALAACTDDLTRPALPTGPAADIVPVLARDTATVGIGDTLQLEATLANPQGHGFAHKKERYQWASSDPSVATVDGDGVVTGVARGSALVTVEHKGAADTVAVTVVLEEARALWVTKDEYNSPARIVEIMTRAKRANLNVVYFQVRRAADAYYRSDIEPCAAQLCGSLGNGQPSWDPLEVAVTEAHARGIQLHAWLNALPGLQSNTAAQCAALQPSAPGQPNHILVEHPEYRMHWSSGVAQVCPNTQEYVYLSPGHPEVRTRLARVAADVTRRYDVDGVHLDRIRYPDSPFSWDPVSVAAFGRNPSSDPAAWAQFRRDLVSATVKETHDSINAVRPEVVLSAAVWPIYDRTRMGWTQSSSGYSQFFQDSWGWANGGYLDVAVPMTYYNIRPVYCSYVLNNPDWACMLDDHLAGMAPSGRHVYIAIGANRAFAEYEKEIILGRARGVKGFAFFSYTEMNSRDRWRILGDGLFREPASVPRMHWK
jgi:uncharacterized lipoprotein YddW (UPF0748 family)